jgi:hypothetical protein
MISHGSVKQPQKRKSSKNDSLDLEARARVTFAATADDPQESEANDQEGMSSEGLHDYLDKVINEVNKSKSNSSQIHKEDKIQT